MHAAYTKFRYRYYSSSQVSYDVLCTVLLAVSTVRRTQIIRGSLGTSAGRAPPATSGRSIRACVLCARRSLEVCVVGAAARSEKSGSVW